MADDRCLLSFGVLTDVQYADRDDQVSWYSASKIRYYRSSLDQVRKAFKKWLLQNVSFVVQLGDVLDASNRTMGLDCEEAMARVLDTFRQYHIPTYHVIGNHELDTFDRTQLAKYKLNYAAASDQRYYYSLRPTDDVTVLFLDCLEVSLMGQQHGHPNYVKALSILSQYHSTADKALWEMDDHLVGQDKRFVSYNGALSEQQISWLDEQLEKADADGHRVIIFGHLALLASSSHWTCVCWNWEEVLNVVHRYKCVVAYLSGHLHDTGYDVDKHGVHHVTLGGIIEVPPEEKAFSTVNVYKDRMEIVGFGREKSYVLPYGSSTIGTRVPVLHLDGHA